VFFTSEFAKLNSDYFTIQYPPNLQNKDKDNYIKSFLKEYSNIYFVCPSEWSHQGMDSYLTNKSRNRIITHGVDTSIFKKVYETRNTIRKRYNIKDSDILMLNIGAMTTNKGILLVFESLNILVNKMKKKEYKLMLKGSQDLYTCKEFLNQYFENFKNNSLMTIEEINNLLDNHIIFTDKTISYTTLNELFNACDLYISPYLAEGFNLVALESITSGLPILIPRTGSTKEFIQDIYNNYGKEYIHYVDSQVGSDSLGMCQNIISVNNIVDILLKKEYLAEKSNENYTKMINYIEKEYSWNKVGELLYKYLKFIVKGKSI
jgi:glycosyltransferase involved in cell wall biosynthesis